MLLHRDILDHQLVDTDEVQVIRAADLYLAQVGDQVRLVGVDVSLQTLLRRLGPKRFRWHPTPTGSSTGPRSSRSAPTRRKRGPR